MARYKCKECEVEISDKENDRYSGLCPTCFEYEEARNKTYKTDLTQEEWERILGQKPRKY